jgi:organic radical activating enzyme
MRLNKDEIKKEIKTNPHFCLVPFTNEFYPTAGRKSFCCQQSIESRYDAFFEKVSYDEWDSKGMQDVRERILSGKPLPECEVCYEKERNNKTSIRQHINEKYMSTDRTIHGTSLEFDYIDTVTGTNHERAITLDLRMSNLCNLKCRMCSGFSSSRILAEADKNEFLRYYGYPDKLDKEAMIIADNAVVSDETLDQLQVLKLAGGEPSIMPQCLEILDRLIALGNTDLLLQITTNAVILKKSFLKRLNKFSNIVFHFSVDGFRQVNDYIRDDSSWKVVDANVKKLINDYTHQTYIYKEDRFRHIVNSVVQIYNIFDWYNVERWASNLKMGVDYGYVNGVPEFDISIMPRKWKDLALQRAALSNIDHPHIIQKLESDEGYSPKLLKKLKTRTLLFDLVRKKRIEDYIPEVAAMLNEID